MSNTILDPGNVLEIHNLRVEFPSEEKKIPSVAVNNISVNLKRGGILGIVGESGSGKSVTSLAIMGLILNPGRVSEKPDTPEMMRGVWFRESADIAAINLLTLTEKQRQYYRGGKIAMIFQEPMSSLNPVYKIGSQLIEAIFLHDPDIKKAKKSNLKQAKNRAWEKAINLLYQVKLKQPEELMERYPHQLSGGQLQRVMIAMAISCDPTILIADEPTTALDVTVQAGILDLLRELCRKRNMSMLFITHDFGVVAEIADDVVVMRNGEIVEQGNVRQILENPQKPYTKGLLACRPHLDQSLEYLPTVDDFLKGYFAALIKRLKETHNENSEIFSQELEELRQEFFSLSHEQRDKLAQEDSELYAQIIVRLQQSFAKSFEKKVSNKQEELLTSQGVFSWIKTLLKPATEKPANTLKALPDISPIYSEIAVPIQKELELSPHKIVPSAVASALESDYILQVDNLSVKFPRRGILGNTSEDFVAVNQVSFQVERGKTLGLVGESGCGKSTLARAILRLIPISNGKIWLQTNKNKSLNHSSHELTHLDGSLLRELRRKMQIVFQNPYNSLNPRLTIGNTIMEPMIVHKLDARKCKKRVRYLLECVDLNPNWINRYPHELSGGQRQRVCIARALASGFDDYANDLFDLNPQFIICDESVSALDVSVQAQVLNLLKRLQREFQLTYLFISHDFGVVRFMSDRILVMHKGAIVEEGLAEQIIHHPEQQYTQELINSIPTGKLTFNLGAVTVGDRSSSDLAYHQLSAYLEKKLGICVQYHPIKDYAEAIHDFHSGKLDLVYLGALSAIIARTKVRGTEAIAQLDTDRNCRSVLIANHKSGVELITDIKDLRFFTKYKFLFVNEWSTSQFLLPFYYLQQAGILLQEMNEDLDEKVSFSLSPETSIKLIQTGIYKVGALKESIWQNLVDRGEVDLNRVQVVWRSPAYSNAQWLIHPHAKKRYGEHFPQQVQAALLQLNLQIPEEETILGLLAANRFLEPSKINTEIIETLNLIIPDVGESSKNYLRDLIPLVPKFCQIQKER